MIQILKIIANACIIVGAIVISTITAAANFYYVFVLFLICHIIWTYISIIEWNKGYIWMNAPMIIFDIYAIFIRF